MSFSTLPKVKRKTEMINYIKKKRSQQNRETQTLIVAYPPEFSIQCTIPYGEGEH